MFDISKLAEFKLERGPNSFPFKHGGLCLNEAAVVAAGFEYRAVDSAHDCPPCFSYVIATYALHLNDRMPDRERNQLLKPFILRLAGTDDEPAVEERRIEYICSETLRRILEPVCSKPVLQDLIKWGKVDKQIKMGWVPSSTFSAIAEADSPTALDAAADATFAAAYATCGAERHKILRVLTKDR